MFKFVVFAALLALAAAGASLEDINAEVKNYKVDVRPDGFEYILETTNKITQQAKGDEHGNIVGEYDYISPEGEHILVSYEADENGYKPDGLILPTPPPIPEAIVKALEYIRTHPSKDDH